MVCQGQKMQKKVSCILKCHDCAIKLVLTPNSKQISSASRISSSCGAIAICTQQHYSLFDVELMLRCILLLIKYSEARHSSFLQTVILLSVGFFQSEVH